MLTDVGEFLVGACLQMLEGCDVVDYNVRLPGGGMAGLGEMDVIGLNFATNTAFVCEVSTHIRGLEYGKGPADTAARIAKKHERQKAYAELCLKHFSTKRFQFWSPVVPVGGLMNRLKDVEGLELVVNGAYKTKVLELRKLAAKHTHDARNPVFRLLQILERMRD